MTPFQEFLESKYAHDKYLANGATWTAGGCWLLAEAVRGVLGGQYLAVIGSSGVTEHVAVWHKDRLIDGDGFSTPEIFVRRWQNKYKVKGAFIAAFDPEHAKVGGMRPPTKYIARHLEEDLQPYLK